MALAGKAPASFAAGMDLPHSPPPLPPASGKNRVGIILAVLGAFGAIVMIAAVVVGIATFRRVQEKAAASREALSQLEKTAAEARGNMADLIESGDATGGDAVLGRVKDQLEKSAANLNGRDALTMRALASVTGTMQGQVREYDALVKRMTQAELFSFKIREKAALEAHREILRDFLDSNDRLTATILHGEDLLRAELDKAGVSAKMRDATVAGFVRSQQISRPLQLRIREADQTLGKAGLVILDLLEKNWGKWRPGEDSGAPIFDDGKTLDSYNASIEQIQTAAADQAKAQEELVRSMRAK